MKKLVTCSLGAKSCARQIVREAFNDILSGNFHIPSQEEMENLLKDSMDYDFDEYQIKKKIEAKHTSWGDERVNDEVYKLKLRYDKEYQQNFMQAILEAFAEIESLIRSLNDAIKAWKIKNLE